MSYKLHYVKYNVETASRVLLIDSDIIFCQILLIAIL
ncbi:hypothetical protein FHS90_003785 [Rufibacter quisquiliarum]|uniref:Uncharacterized protein n=1 Tax=Rufibacter quisquiliarum TaxID=1549639 RepID=A0A839GK64_9BACT|nr:hypothetical protein [Rufibacter quisquiliarum]